MTKSINLFLKGLIKKFVAICSTNKVGRFFINQILNSAMDFRREINHGGVRLSFVTPNGLNQFRIESFSTKEPETLEWIDNIPENSILWDVGANVGIYSCYAASSRKCQVVAFEPSVFNLELLSRNIFINNLVAKILILPLPLTDRLTNSTLNMTTTEWGGAISTFGRDYTHDGSKLKKIFEFHTVGVSMADAIDLLKLPQPNYIKMDVDGIEHLILKGGHSVLNKVDGVIIEINESFEKQTKDSSRYLKEAGLVLREKRQSELFSGSTCYNQIWYRP